MPWESLVIPVSLAVSVTTLVLSFLTYRWTKRQDLVETFDLVPFWHWSQDGANVGAYAALGCHNRSNKSIYVEKVEVLTRGLIFYSRPMQGIDYTNPADNPLPQIIAPDETFKFRINVSNAVRSIDFSKRQRPWVYKFDGHSVIVRLTTASGSKREIKVRELIPQDVLEEYVRAGKTHERI